MHSLNGMLESKADWLMLVRDNPKAPFSWAATSKVGEGATPLIFCLSIKYYYVISLLGDNLNNIWGLYHSATEKALELSQ